MSDWEAIDSAPKDGTRLRLGHERDTGSMKPDAMFKTHGHWDGERWVLSAFFIVPGGKHGLMSCEPTHWMPGDPQ